MNPTLKGSQFLFFALLVAVPWTSTRAADGSLKPNSEAMTEAFARAVENFCKDANIPDTASASLAADSGEVNRFFAPTALQEFHKHFASLYVHRGGTSVELSSSVARVGVFYGEPFSDGFFSGRKCDRRVDVDVQFSALTVADGKVLWAGTLRGTCEDTVYVSDVKDLQRGTQWIATGSLPSSSAWERLLEPMIIAGAAGVAVYLFFTIRS